MTDSWERVFGLIRQVAAWSRLYVFLNIEGRDVVRRLPGYVLLTLPAVTSHVPFMLCETLGRFAAASEAGFPHQGQVERSRLRIPRGS